MQRHLILFARLPRYGTGKRRLAREIGEPSALRFQRLMLARLLRRLGRHRRWRLRLAVTPDCVPPLRLASPNGITVIGQGNGDLGERMRRALAACPPGPAVLVGNDIPALSAGHIAEAFGLLGTCDLVFGPAEDGGFWLVGARRRPRMPQLFGTVRWSTEHALGDVLNNLPRWVSIGFAARLNDVDNAAAYRGHGPIRGF
jgi:rSAM/selenodomain-associated transferase 1